MRIVFPHIPKCAGSSIKSQILNRPDYIADYFNHPTWQYTPDIVAGSEQQRRLIDGLGALKSWVVFGHFAPRQYNDVDFDVQILILRDPVERAISHFHYVRTLLPDNEVTTRRHPEVRAIKDGLMSIEEFIELDHIKHFYGGYYLKDLQKDERLKVFSLNDMVAACEFLSSIMEPPINPRIRYNENNYDRTKDLRHIQTVLKDDTEIYLNLIS